jgi:hypothetical protein
LPTRRRTGCPGSRRRFRRRPLRAAGLAAQYRDILGAAFTPAKRGTKPHDARGHWLIVQDQNLLVVGSFGLDKLDLWHRCRFQHHSLLLTH